MITADQAIATAQQWEAEKAAGPSALVGRALLAHINSLASPQVTDEQISQIIADNSESSEFSDNCGYSMVYERHIPRIGNALRALLSAPPAAEMLAGVQNDANRLQSLAPAEKEVVFKEALELAVSAIKEIEGEDIGTMVCTIRALSPIPNVTAEFTIIENQLDDLTELRLRSILREIGMTETAESMHLAADLHSILGLMRARIVAAAPQEAETVAPDGWVLVPKEPTDAMQAAGPAAIRFDTTIINKMWTANAVYRAMIAAAPQEQAPADRNSP